MLEISYQYQEEEGKIIEVENEERVHIICDLEQGVLYLGEDDGDADERSVEYLKYYFA